MIPTYHFAIRSDLEGSEFNFLPSKSEPKATGWDVRCAEPNGITVLAGELVKVRLGFRMFAPPGWWLELRPRSGSFTKKSLHALYGVIDETYENEVIFAARFLAVPNEPTMNIVAGTLIPSTSMPKLLDIEFGERIGQVIPVERQEMEVVQDSNEGLDDRFTYRAASRGTGGFGSTGDK